jgi:hypothetical protein
MPRPQSMALILLVFGLSGVSCRDSSENGGAGAFGGGAGGTTGNDGAGSDAGISLDGLSQALAAAHCAKIFECCTASEREKIPQLGGTVEACTSTTAGSVSALIAQVRSSISDGRIAYHGDRVAACVEATRTADCETLRRAISPDLDCTAALERAFEPLVRVGGACRRHKSASTDTAPARLRRRTARVLQKSRTMRAASIGRSVSEALAKVRSVRARRPRHRPSAAADPNPGERSTTRWKAGLDRRTWSVPLNEGIASANCDSSDRDSRTA